MKFIFLQTPIITDSISNPIVEEKTLSIMELISSGGIGGNIIMGTLGLLSIYAIYILIERFSTIKKASIEDESFLKSIKNLKYYILNFFFILIFSNILLLRHDLHFSCLSGLILILFIFRILLFLISPLSK